MVHPGEFRYDQGYRDGYEAGFGDGYREGFRVYTGKRTEFGERRKSFKPPKKRRANRPPNRWNKYVAKKSNQIRYKSGSDKGKLNLKSMANKYRKKYKLKKGR